MLFFILLLFSCFQNSIHTLFTYPAIVWSARFFSGFFLSVSLTFTLLPLLFFFGIVYQSSDCCAQFHEMVLCQCKSCLCDGAAVVVKNFTLAVSIVLSEGSMFYTAPGIHCFLCSVPVCSDQFSCATSTRFSAFFTPFLSLHFLSFIRQCIKVHGTAVVCLPALHIHIADCR